GGSLAEHLGGMPQEPRVAAQLVETLARAIHYAHQQGILHRDLKPANVLLQEKGNIGSQRPDAKRGARGGLPADFLFPNSDFSPKISDCGRANPLDRQGNQTESGTICGTPSYMAPEQASGPSRDLTAAVDVYALGAILYELLTGRPPFRAESL